jgi:hypothetical protein
MQKIKSYPETHQFGLISIENIPENKLISGDLGIQIADDGRIWVCINGIAFIRFKPAKKEKNE